MSVRKNALLLITVLSLFLPNAWAQTNTDAVDQEMVAKIKEEGESGSQVMETISYMTDVYGPRLTSSPLADVAADWTLSRLESWGMENVHLEEWGPFGRGWTLEGCSVNMVEPRFTPMIAHVKAWSPSTTKTIRSVPIYMDVESEEDLEKYRGKLGRAIVLISPPRSLEALFEPSAVRKTDEQLLRLANAQPPTARRRSSSSRRTPPSQASSAPAASNDQSKSNSQSENKEPEKKAPEPPREMSEIDKIRAAMRLRADKWDMAYREGAAVILEPGRGDGGNVFVSSVTMPRVSDDKGESGNRMSRGPRPWATDSTDIIPQAVMAAEHYNQLVRMIEKGAAPKLEVDILTRYHKDTNSKSFNIIAEIPGSDLKDEIVMLGAHFDSWQAGTGATDNAVGCGVAMEAIRILKAIDAKPRRTVRLALWTGEEQGLLGSRAYVKQHFGEAVYEENDRRKPPTYQVTAAHEKISAYYNLDNGTGAIRGIYLQGNEQLRSIFRGWLSPFADMGASTVTASNTGGTDHQSFDAIGIPGFQFIQDAVEYNTRTHHSSMDVFDRIQEEDVKQASMIMATFVYQTAMRDELLPRKPLRGEVVRRTPPSDQISIPETAEVSSSQ